MYCDICGNPIPGRDREANPPLRVEATTVFIDLCSDDCAARYRAERNEVAPVGRFPELSNRQPPLLRPTDRFRSHSTRHG